MSKQLTIDTPIKEMGDVVTGKTPLTAVLNYYGTKYKFITPTELHDGYMITHSEKMLSEKGLNSIKGSIISGLSVLVGCIGWDMGNVALCQDKCATNQQINTITNFKPEYNPYYVYYWLSMKKEYLFKIASVTRTPILNKSTFEDIVIPMPERAIQDKTSAILMSVDIKIQINNRIFGELESMAKTIYDYWFVQFDFPNAEGKPYRASGGEMVWNVQLKREIPKGWHVEQIGTNDKVRFKRGFSYSSEDIKSGEGTPMINLASVSRNQEYIPSGIKFVSNRVSEDCIVKPFEMLIACTDLTRQAEIIGCPIITPTEYAEYAFSMDLARVVIDTKKLTRSYLYRSLRTKFYHKYIKGFASGTNVIHLDLDGIKWYYLAIPPIELQDKYEDVHTPIIAKQVALLNENKELEALRDWLLPMLINGQVTVG